MIATITSQKLPQPIERVQSNPFDTFRRIGCLIHSPDTGTRIRAILTAAASGCTDFLPSLRRAYLRNELYPASLYEGNALYLFSQ